MGCISLGLPSGPVTLIWSKKMFVPGVALLMMLAADPVHLFPSLEASVYWGMPPPIAPIL